MTLTDQGEPTIETLSTLSMIKLRQYVREAGYGITYLSGRSQDDILKIVADERAKRALSGTPAYPGPQCHGATTCPEPATWLRIVPGSQNQYWYCSAHYGRYMGMPGRWLGPSDPKPAPKPAPVAQTACGHPVGDCNRCEHCPGSLAQRVPHTSTEALNGALKALDDARDYLRSQGGGGQYWANELRQPRAHLANVRDMVAAQEETFRKEQAR